MKAIRGGARLMALFAIGVQAQTTCPNQVAQITSPAAGATLPAGAVTFAWCHGAGDYFLDIESLPGAHNIFYAFLSVESISLGPACNTPNATSPTTQCIVPNGETIYVTLWTNIAQSGRKNYVAAPTLTFTAATGVSPPEPGLSAVGSMAQVASGGLWNTTITLVNNGSAAATARLNFFDDNGSSLPMPLTFPQTASTAPLLVSTLDRTIGPGATLIIQTAGQPSDAPLAGWAQLLATGNISGFAIFAWRTAGGQQEAVAPLEIRNPGSFILSFDNTGGYATGVAVANVAAQAAVAGVVVRDDAGAVLSSSTITLPAQGHAQFMVTDMAALTAGLRGTIEFQTPVGGQISVLGIRANPAGAITNVPALAK